VSGAIEIVEVGARDGLQNEPGVVATDAKVALISRAVAAGIRRIEAASFVHPGRVPQMADAEAVLAALPRPEGVRYIGLVLNLRGCERALAAGCDEIGMAVAATDAFGLRNQGLDRAAALASWQTVAAAAQAAGVPAQITISAAFGCPFEGEVPVDKVVDLVRRVAEAGPFEIALADTIGAGVPTQVTELVGRVSAAVPGVRLRLHFHNTRNTALANAYAGLLAGVRTFDGSLGGVGGCPFAPAATGNVATEDLVYLFERMGYATGLELGNLIEAGRWLGTVLGRPLPSMLGRAGPFPPLAAG
jgi:hydroxymethylglutaryl-CoA lyase